MVFIVCAKCSLCESEIDDNEDFFVTLVYACIRNQSRRSARRSALADVEMVVIVLKNDVNSIDSSSVHDMLRFFMFDCKSFESSVDKHSV